MSSDDTPSRTAVKTTIVGGQPPGNARDLDDVPMGLEQLLALAGASPEFKRALLADRERAAEAAGVALTPTEQAVLRATGDAVLTKMIDQVETALPKPERRAFLEQAAGALAVLLGAGVAGGCKGDKKGAGAQSSDPPAPPMRPMGEGPIPKTPVGIRPNPPEPAKPAGIRPDKPRPVEPKPPKAGISPMKPEPKAAPKRPRPMVQTRAGVRPRRPMGGPKKNAGVSAGRLFPGKRSRPMRVGKSRGISPYRTPMTGIRSGREDDE